MAQDGGSSDDQEQGPGQPKKLGEEHSGGPFGHVARQHGNCHATADIPEHVGRAGIAGAGAEDVHAPELAGEEGEGDGTQQIAG